MACGGADVQPFDGTYCRDVTRVSRYLNS
jgi:hypothetical protein